MPKINFKQQQSIPPPNKVKLVPSGIFIQDPTTEEPLAEESEETAPPVAPFDFGRELQRLLNSETTARSQIDGVKPLSHLSAIRRVAASEVSVRQEIWHLVETEEDERTMRQTIYLQFKEGMKRV